MAEEATAQVSIYLLPAAKTAATRIREQEGKLNAEIAFDAIDAVSAHLQDLVRARQRTPRQKGSLFPDRASRRRPRVRKSVGEERRVLWTLQATPEEMMVLEELVKVTGADSVSMMVSAAIEADLLDDGQ